MAKDTHGICEDRGEEGECVMVVLLCDGGIMQQSFFLHILLGNVLQTASVPPTPPPLHHNPHIPYNVMTMWRMTAAIYLYLSFILPPQKTSLLWRHHRHV